MSIPLLTNFTINQNAPIDSRLVVTSSSARDSITYKYDGLTIFKTDDRTSWTYNAITATWSQNLGSGGSGIYGGSGALIGDTYVFTGPVSNSAGSSSKKFILSASSSPSNNIYFSSYFNRTVFGSTWPSVEYRMQYSYDSNTSNNVFISMNPLEPIANLSGGIDIGTSNVRRFTITSNGIVRLWSPTYSSDFNTSNLTANRTYNLPNNSGTLALLSDIPTSSVTSFYEVNPSNITTSRVESFSNLSTSTAYCVAFIYIRINSISGGFVQLVLNWIDPILGSLTYGLPTSYNTTGYFNPIPVSFRMAASSGATLNINIGGTVNYNYGIKIVK